jgi:hypothetical protein
MTCAHLFRACFWPSVTRRSERPVAKESARPRRRGSWCLEFALVFAVMLWLLPRRRK